jgi:hypothetical protein
MAEQHEAFLSLWVDGEPVDDIDDRLQRVEVVERTHDASSFRIVLSMSPSDQDASWPLLDDERFHLMRRLTVALGVGPYKTGEPEALVVVLDGYITSLEPYFGPDRVPDSTLEIGGLDASCLMHFEARVREWYDKSDSQIVREIYESYGFDCDIADMAPTRSRDRSSVLQRSTDAEFVRMLARRNGCECFVEPRDTSVTQGSHPGRAIIGHFHRPRLDSKPQPALSLSPRAYPSLMSMRARWQSHRPTSVVARHLDPHTRRIQTSSQDGPKLPKLGSQSRIDLIGPRLQTLKRGATLRPLGLQHERVPHDQSELDNFVFAAHMDNDWLAEATGKVQGLRYETIVRPRRLVDVEGAGTQLDGPWYVRSAAHVWERNKATDSYEVDLEMCRNALGAAEGRASAP